MADTQDNRPGEEEEDDDEIDDTVWAFPQISQSLSA